MDTRILLCAAFCNTKEKTSIPSPFFAQDMEIFSEFSIGQDRDALTRKLLSYFYTILYTFTAFDSIVLARKLLSLE
jgi:hypothetical protein